jgi:hypothetical protein
MPRPRQPHPPAPNINSSSPSPSDLSHLSRHRPLPDFELTSTEFRAQASFVQQPELAQEVMATQERQNLGGSLLGRVDRLMEILRRNFKDAHHDVDIIGIINFYVTIPSLLSITRNNALLY